MHGQIGCVHGQWKLHGRSGLGGDVVTEENHRRMKRFVGRRDRDEDGAREKNSTVLVLGDESDRTGPVGDSQTKLAVDQRGGATVPAERSHACRPVTRGRTRHVDWDLEKQWSHFGGGRTIGFDHLREFQRPSRLGAAPRSALCPSPGS